MARYRRIDPYIWHDDKFPTFSDDAKLLWFHLLTTPRGNPLGCFVQGKTDMAEYLRWSMRRLTAAFAALLSSGSVQYDDGTRLVLLPNYLKYNPLENENQAKMAAKYLSELPYNEQYFQYLKQLLEQYNKPFLEPLLVGIRNRNSIGNGIGNSIGNGTPNTEPYSLALTVNRNTEPETHSPLPPKGGDGFAQFWKAYPKKKSKGDAEKAWKALKPTQDLLSTILTAVERAKTSAEWTKDGGQFIPHPGTWLRRKGWEDEEFAPLTPADSYADNPMGMYADWPSPPAEDFCIHGWGLTPELRVKHGDRADHECGQCQADARKAAENEVTT